MSLDEKVLLRIIEDEKTDEYEFARGIKLLDALNILGLSMPSPCGGIGKCGKCKVKITGDYLPDPTLEEDKLLTEDEINDGYRLACKVLLDKNITLIKPTETGVSRIVINGIGLDLRQYEKLTSKTRRVEEEYQYNFSRNLGLAIDIGTTTVVLYLTDLESGKVFDIESSLNPQAVFGADVISRMHYVSNNTLLLYNMKNLIISEINQLAETVLIRNRLQPDFIGRAVISGNTTMIHFLLGLDVEGLGVYPYIPVTTEMMILAPNEMGIKMNPDGQIIILPSVSAFIGADIIAGIIATQIYKAEKYCLLVDLGTNGEIVLGNRHKMSACAAAMGPAFEGANIEHGSAGIEGAVNSVSINRKGVFYSTIDNSVATGICGSGIIDIVAGLLKTGVVDSGGKMLEKRHIIECLADRLINFKDKPAFRITEHEKEAPIIFTQQDIRQVQLAKSAIATGIDVLLNNEGIAIQDIDKVYLAGGFGSCVDIVSAVTIGLIPKEIKDKIISAGNTSGVGAIQCLIHPELLDMCKDVKEKVQYVDLSSLKNFEDLFVQKLKFDIG